MEKIFSNQFAEIYDISNEIPATVFAYWRDYLDKENPEFIRACQYSLDYFKDKNILVMISDHSGLKGAPPEVLDLIHEWYFPTAITNGLKAEIVLDSEEEIGQISLELMYDEADMQRFIDTNELMTPKVDTLEHAKELAREIVRKFS